MTKLSSTDVALEGFRITRERPAMLLTWAVAAFVFSIVSSTLLVALAGGAFMRLRDLQAAGGTPDPQVMLGLLSQSAPAYGVILVLSLVYYAILYAAGDRALLRPGEKSPGYLRLGRQELMQVLAFVVLWLLFVLVYIGAVIVFLLVRTLAAFAASAAGQFVSFAGFLAILSLMLWLAVRVSLTSAATFDTGKLGVGASWRLTKGHFWPLFGAYLLAGLLMIVIWTLTLIIVAAVAAIIGGGLAAVGAIMRPDLSSLAAYYTPVMIVQLVLSALVSALSLAVMVCAPAYAYRRLRAGGEAGLGTALG